MNSFVMQSSHVYIIVNSTIAVIFPDNIFITKFYLKGG